MHPSFWKLVVSPGRLALLLQWHCSAIATKNSETKEHYLPHFNSELQNLMVCKQYQHKYEHGILTWNGLFNTKGGKCMHGILIHVEGHHCRKSPTTFSWCWFSLSCTFCFSLSTPDVGIRGWGFSRAVLDNWEPCPEPSPPKLLDVEADDPFVSRMFANIFSTRVSVAADIVIYI